MQQLLDNRSGKLIEPKTYVSFKKQGNSLVFNFEAYDSSLNSYSDEDNDELFNGDVVEVFLDLGFEEYFEFEVAPNGAKFVAKIKDGKPVFINDEFLKTQARIERKNYFVKMVVDLSKFDKIKNIKFNAFRIETKGIKPEFILQALSPTLCNTFHVREKFVKLD